MNSISAPRFSGFYKVSAPLEDLKRLPIGKANDLPYLPCQSPNAPDMTWLYVFPEKDQAMQTVLNNGQVLYEMSPEHVVRQKFGRPEDANKPLSVENVSLIGRLLESWSINTLHQGLLGAFNDAFGK